jgi:hypothetical protein
MTPKTSEPTKRRTVLKAIGASAGGFALSGCTSALGGDGLEEELDEVRSATAEYTDPATAYDDGFVVAGPDGPIALENVQEQGHSVCGMGFHFGNRDLMGSTELTEPAILAYGVDDAGDFVLGAVEWAVPKTGEYESESPDIFEHDDGDEEWATLPTPDGQPDMWTLHAWVYVENSDGPLAETNPDERFHPEGCEGHDH